MAEGFNSQFYGQEVNHLDHYRASENRIFYLVVFLSDEIENLVSCFENVAVDTLSFSVSPNLWQNYSVVTYSSSVFVFRDPVASVGRLALSITDRRNSSLRSSNTTGRAFGKPNRTLVPAPMVFRHKTLHLTAELTGKENTTRNQQQQEAGPSGLFPGRMLFLKSRPVCNSVIT